MIAYHLVHPLFQEKLYACDSPDELGYTGIEKISEADFLAQRAMMRVKSGIIITGIVTDDKKDPIAGAKVTKDYDFRSSGHNARTEADGVFRFSNGRPGALVLTVQANDFAPEVLFLRVSTNIENLQIVLPAGRQLLGRVTDESGQPIRGATIEAASATEDSRTLFQRHTNTGDDGRFSWDRAPASQDYAIYASGFQTLSHVTLVADGTEQNVKLGREGSPSIRVLGHVVDAETMLPPSPKIQIWETSRESSSFTTTAENLEADGQFRLSTSAGTFSFVLEAQADGYASKRITNEVSGAAEIHVILELIKTAPVEGSVLTPSREPAAGARLAVCGPQWVGMSEGGKLNIGANGQAPGAIVDAQGHFKLPTQYAADFVVAAHSSGFAELPLCAVGSNATITLQPYGRIEGYVRIGGKAVSGETVRLENMPWGRSRVSLYLASRTAEDGSFHFDFVPAGERLVEREINVRQQGHAYISTYSHGIPVSVRSGETSRVTLGGSGSTLIGKAIAPDSSAPIPWADNIVTLTLKVSTAGAPQRPARGDFPSDQTFQAAIEAFVQQSQTYWTSEQGILEQRLQRDIGRCSVQTAASGLMMFLLEITL
jgi:hypothetical protein